jgi:hypothetical protein
MDIKKSIKEIEQTKRPTIDLSSYDTPPGIELNANSAVGSYFKADPGFKPKPKFFRNLISFRHIDGRIQYKYT